MTSAKKVVPGHLSTFVTIFYGETHGGVDIQFDPKNMCILVLFSLFLSLLLEKSEIILNLQTHRTGQSVQNWRHNWSFFSFFQREWRSKELSIYLKVDIGAAGRVLHVCS